ncbi:glycosyltransferase family 39 protein [Nocardia terpenica]|uniref:glycosyltransferase family 39 protein n=1 Tax=Nocardia terpenica TaxID=455432 RepID=UPI0002FC521C|nr:glycosyltransferase family 39 protein [Nocardia terpenica]NQE90259.1 hypothetical protein [Nocardia terpenica]
MAFATVKCRAAEHTTTLALWAIAAVAAVTYCWGIGAVEPEIFYAAAARSMSTSWHNFVFAAFDPEGTVSVDKLPGAFWIQAASVRIFGPHVWAVMLPQAIEGVLTILVLHRAIRRIAGPVAGLVAAAAMACTPVTVALNRGNISDTLLILLLVLAADTMTTAILANRPRWLLPTGLLVGLAFQAKMIQAWLILPVFLLAWLVGTPAGRWRQRMGWAAAMIAVAGVVSFSWMTVVSLIPADRRPYVDASQHNSLFEQVFVYNLPGRHTTAEPLVLGPANRFDHLLGGAGGRSIGWLVPIALVCLIALTIRAIRHRGRADPLTAGLALWGSWLVGHAAVFLVAGTVYPYYLAVLAPAIAAVLGVGAAEFAGQLGTSPLRRYGPAAAIATAGYAWWLFAPASNAVRWGVPVLAVAIAVTAAGLRGIRCTAALIVAILLPPAAASVAVVTDGGGAFDTAFQPVAVSRVTHTALHAAREGAGTVVTDLGADDDPVLAAYTSLLAAPMIFATGAEVRPIGGFLGAAPVPSVEGLARMVADGQLRLVLLESAYTGDDRAEWIRNHCRRVDSGPDAAARTLKGWAAEGIDARLYDCG